MRRNADLDYVQRNPLIQAINIVMSQNKKSKGGIWISLAGLFCSFLYFLRIKKQQQKKRSKIDLLSIQDPFNKELLQLVDQKWQEGNYDNFTYLLPQYKQIGNMSIFKNIFVYAQAEQNITLGTLTFGANSNYVLTRNVPRTKLIQIFKPTIARFISENMHVDFTRQKDYIQGAFLKDFNQIQVGQGLLQSLARHPEQKSIIFNYVAQKLFRNESLFSGVNIEWTCPTPLALNKKELLCMQCTAVIKDNEIRITNIKAAANDFVRLKMFLKANINAKLEIIQSKLTLSKILMSIFGFLAIYQIGRQIYYFLEPYMLKQEYPGLDRVKRRLDKVVCDYGTKCVHCKSKPVDFIFVPCYHLQCCKSCFGEKKQIECLTCKKMIFCGIPIFVCK